MKFKRKHIVIIIVTSLFVALCLLYSKPQNGLIFENPQLY